VLSEENHGEAIKSLAGRVSAKHIIRLFNHLCNHPRRYLFSLLIAFLIFGLWPFNFSEKNEARIRPEGGLSIARHGTAYTSASADKLHDLKQFSIYVDLTTSSDGLGSLEKIFGHFIGQEDENFFLAQWKDGLELRVRTERNAGGMIFGEDGIFKKEERVACLIIYDGLKMHLYKNGSISRRDNRGPLSFSNWDKAYPLVVGTDAGGRSQWRGVLYEVAIYDRAITPAEVQGSKGSGGQKKAQVQGFKQKVGSMVQRFRGSKERTGSRGDQEDKRPLIHYVFKPENTYETEFRGKKAIGVRDLGKGESADLVIPAHFMPYQRVYLGWDPDWMRNRSDLLDVAVNIIGFIPFGILMVLSLRKVGTRDEGVGTSAAERQARSVKCQVLSEEEKVQGFKGSGVQNRETGSGVQRFKGSKIIGLVLLTVVAGFVVSFAIEYLQAYLPSRDSSLRDLICNTVGTAMGAVAAVLLLAKSNWEMGNG
jgi:hypothetical protein